MLQGGRVATFAPATGRGDAEALPIDFDDAIEDVWVPGDHDGSDQPRGGSRERGNKLQTKLTPKGFKSDSRVCSTRARPLRRNRGSASFLALGFLEWREAKQSEVARFAPLILLPVDPVRDGARDRFKLRSRQDDLYTNVSLQAWLHDQFGIDLPDLPEGDDWTPSQYVENVVSAVEVRPGWKVHAKRDSSRLFLVFKIPDVARSGPGELARSLTASPTIRC